MPTERTRIRCTLCGVTVSPARLGLDAETGAFSGEVHEPGSDVYVFGGRGRITHIPQPLPMHFALGLRDALRAALARVEEEIAEAGGEGPQL